jgi:hypothetical protein
MIVARFSMMTLDAGAQTGARAQKTLQIAMLAIVSKTVSGFSVRRGFKSLPLRSPSGFRVGTRFRCRRRFDTDPLTPVES